jgi:hypothetical protein
MTELAGESELVAVVEDKIGAPEISLHNQDKKFHPDH